MKVNVIALIVLCCLCCMSTSQAAVVSENLFSDSFDRPGNNDIDASSEGMDGLLAPMTYVEIGDDEIYPAQSGTGNPYPELTHIDNNQLYMAFGTNMSTLYLDHNFVDSEILAADGMRIGLTIVQDLGVQIGAQYFMGFGIGNTLQECQSTWFDQNGTGFRGQVNITPVREGTSDLWVGWSPANGGTIQVFKNGPTSAGGENYDLLTGVALTNSDRLELELFFDSFEDGSVVNANIIWNKEIIGVETFAWDSDGLLENYIGVNGRQSTGWIVDDLAIEAIYNNRAHNPVPEDGAVKVPVGPITLQWDMGKDSNGDPNALIKGHHLYVTKELTDGEPNFASSTMEYYFVEDITDPITQVLDNDVDYNEVTYWRVDEAVLVNGSASGPDDPNTIKGPVWHYEAVQSVPEIISQPEHTAAFPGESASFSVSVSSVTQESYIWYKSIDDVVDTSDMEVDSGSESYTINSVGVEHEAYYYCKVTNTGTGEEGAQYTTPAYLTVKRQLLHWDFEGDFLDSSGENNDGVTDLGVPTFEEDVPGAIGTQSAKFDGTDQRLTATVDPNNSHFYAGFTLTMWIRPAELNQIVNVSMFNNNNGGDYDFQIDFGDIGNIRYQGTDNQVIVTPVTDWMHIAVVCDGTTTTIYHDLKGDQAVISNGADIVFGQFQIGCNRAGDRFFNGLIDNVQIWNYPRTYEQMVKAVDDNADYYDVMEGPACQLRPEFDLNGDCKVDLVDLSDFAGTWLECGLYPPEDC